MACSRGASDDCVARRIVVVLAFGPFAFDDVFEEHFDYYVVFVAAVNDALATISACANGCTPLLFVFGVHKCLLKWSHPLCLAVIVKISARVHVYSSFRICDLALQPGECRKKKLEVADTRWESLVIAGSRW